MKCTGVGAHRLCWQVTQKGSGIPRLGGAWPWCPSVERQHCAQEVMGSPVGEHKEVLQGAGDVRSAWGCFCGCRNSNALMICQDVPVSGRRREAVSSFMGILGEGAFSRFRFNLWFVRAVTEIIEHQDLSMQGGGRGLSPGRFFLGDMLTPELLQ